MDTKENDNVNVRYIADLTAARHEQLDKLKELEGQLTAIVSQMEALKRKLYMLEEATNPIKQDIADVYNELSAINAKRDRAMNALEGAFRNGVGRNYECAPEGCLDKQVVDRAAGRIY